LHQGPKENQNRFFGFKTIIKAFGFGSLAVLGVLVAISGFKVFLSSSPLNPLVFSTSLW